MWTEMGRLKGLHLWGLQGHCKEPLAYHLLCMAQKVLRILYIQESLYVCVRERYGLPVCINDKCIIFIDP